MGELAITDIAQDVAYFQDGVFHFSSVHDMCDIDDQEDDREHDRADKQPVHNLVERRRTGCRGGGASAQ